MERDQDALIVSDDPIFLSSLGVVSRSPDTIQTWLTVLSATLWSHDHVSSSVVALTQVMPIIAKQSVLEIGFMTFGTPTSKGDAMMKPRNRLLSRH